MKIIKRPVYAVVALLLFQGGCSSDDHHGGDEYIAINTFAVVGTVDPVPGDSTAIIDQNANGGNFSVNWAVSYHGGTSSGYHMEIFLSEDTTTSQNDHSILGRFCDSSATNCTETGVFGCNISAGFVITCDGNVNGTDVSQDYQTLSYAIAVACVDTDVGELCNYKSVPIKIQ